MERATRFLLAAAALLLLSSSVSAAVGKRTLVLLQKESARSKYSSFLDGLQAAGYDLVVKGYKDSELKLRDYDTWLYDHLVILTPKAESA